MSMDLKPIDEQAIVITGASSGIGLATAALAAECGAKVVLAARSERTLQEVVDRIEEEGAEAIAVGADVARREDLERVAGHAIERFGRIDTWVNDAGVSIYGRLEEVTEEDSRRLFDTNFWGVVNGSLAALPHLRKNGGAIINLGGELSESFLSLQGMYTASKHAVKGFTDALRVELEQLEEAPISVTLVQPAATDTPFPQNAKSYMAREPKLPMPRIDPFDVAGAILDAAVNPTPYQEVGATTKPNASMAKVIPGLAGRVAAMHRDREQDDEPPRDAAGTLFRPSGSGRTHGVGDRRD